VPRESGPALRIPFAPLVLTSPLVVTASLILALSAKTRRERTPARVYELRVASRPGTVEPVRFPALSGQFNAADFILVGIILILIDIVVRRNLVRVVLLDRFRRIASGLRDVLSLVSILVCACVVPGGWREPGFPGAVRNRRCPARRP
jgi:hypothetical protein